MEPVTELWQLGALDQAERMGSGDTAHVDGRDAHPAGVEQVGTSAHDPVTA
jgi:hypothetical protein